MWNTENNKKLNFSYSVDMIYIWSEVRELYENIKNKLKNLISKK
jgi:hypothetical protein